MAHVPPEDAKALAHLRGIAGIIKLNSSMILKKKINTFPRRICTKIPGYVSTYAFCVAKSFYDHIIQNESDCYIICCFWVP